MLVDNWTSGKSYNRTLTSNKLVLTFRAPKKTVQNFNMIRSEFPSNLTRKGQIGTGNCISPSVGNGYSSLPRRQTAESVKRRQKSHVFEDHEVVDEKDAFALEQFPDSLSTLSLRLRQRLYVSLLTRREQVHPMCVLKQWRKRQTRHVVVMTTGVCSCCSGPLIRVVWWPQYGSCSSVRPSVRPSVRVPNSKTKKRRKPKLARTFPAVGLTGVPIFSRKGQADGRTICRHWADIVSK